MSDDRAFERTTAEWLEAGSDRTPPHAIDAVLLAIRTTPQERDLRIPWRTIPMPAALRIAAVVAFVAVAGVVTINLLRPGPDTGVGGSPIASPTVAPIDTSAWVPYVSERYGFSIAYPEENWEVRPATRDWMFPEDANDWAKPGVELFSTPGAAEGLGIAVTAWSVDMDGTAPDEWIAGWCSWNGTSCTHFEDVAFPVQMDGHAGWLVQVNDDTQAFIPVEGRMYSITIGWKDGDPAVLPYGGARRLLEAFLSTVQLEPAT